MKIIHVVGGSGFGGNESMARNLIGGLDPERFVSEVIYLGDGNDPAVTMNGLPVIPFRLHSRRTRYWRLARLVARRCRTAKETAVLCYGMSVPHLWSLAGAAAGGARIRLGRLSAWPSDPRSRRKTRMLLRAARLLGTQIVAVSHHVAGEVLSGRSFPAARLHTIPNGCPVEAIRRRAGESRRSRSDTSEFRLVMVARFDDSKDQACLIRALQILAGEFPALRLRLVGDGPMKPDLEKLVQAFRLRDRVEFLGSRLDVPEILGRSDLFVMSSRHEGFGLALVEAMAAEIPTACSDLPSLLEISENGRYSRVFRGGDAESLAAAVRELVQDSGIRERLVGEAFLKVKTDYDMNRVAADYERLLA